MIFNFPARRLEAGWYCWIVCREYIQTALPFLSPDEREFLMTGLTPKAYERLMDGCSED